ncbi:general stress protein 13 [Anoxybacillus calidus]|jgi:general stress protein 13|uniref:General stress protein 13 n=1 Tax=[Anoxybacillus] calidus TaxID=575178 RepID=A0A7W0BWR8_9BACL|nr:S1 domain-containing post-transcriptional regulator GSP13 [Anoxybacillus calidus]MBA2871526.1 general stress protein 13 [Anoxybacillus calidus]
MAKFAVGSIVKGKVTGIQPYGVFVALDEDTQGLVHISEIAHGFVKDINEHVRVGDEVTVKVLSVDEESKRISLSIKATESQPVKQALVEKKVKRQAKIKTSAEEPRGFNTLKEKLQEWIEQSKREDLLNK